MYFNLAIISAIIPAVVGYAIPPTARAGDVIPNQYIVVLKDSVSEAEFSTHRAWATERHSAASKKRDLESLGVRGLEHLYNFGKLKGYSGTFDAETIEEIASRTEVAYVEPDRVVTANALVTQSSVPSWGLARISHRTTGYSTYVYDSTAGQGITAYIVDTGVRPTHNDFGGRASSGYNVISGEGPDDGNGHGTHVAGTVAGTTYGVSKSATIIGVKVLSSAGSGSNSGVIAGINWVVSNAQSTGRIGKAVANMSLGGSFSSATNSAVNNAVAAGVVFVVAAGNSNANAANYSPASAASAITVGATTSTDARASYSNYGSVLDVFAPGSSITSAWYTSNSATNTISGTSMASPHVAGVAAYLMSYEGLTSPSSVVSRIVALSTTDVVTSPGSGSPNRLVYNGSGQ